MQLQRLLSGALAMRQLRFLLGSRWGFVILGAGAAAEIIRRRRAAARSSRPAMAPDASRSPTRLETLGNTREQVEEASDESFPASDPPSFTPVTSV